MIPGARCLRYGVLFSTLLAATLTLAQPASASIEYSVSIAHPERHLFNVTMRVPAVRNYLTVQMPAWNGLYQIRDFASHMLQVSAQDESNRPLPIEKIDKQTWRVTGKGVVTLSYPIYWDLPGPFGSQLNPDHAFLNLAMVLMYVPDRRSEDTRIAFEDVPEQWRVAVELDSVGTAASHRTNSYAASSYDALVDAPVEIGQFDEFRIEAGGRPIRVVVHGEEGDRGHLSDALKRIVDYDVSLMGGAPFREYLFLFHVGQNFGGGGMEHSNCTAIAADIPSQMPTYSAHEFFHTWNVKRIRPQALEPVDYTKEMFTKALWFAEGVTSTYSAYALVRTGLWSTQQFYADLSTQITTLESRPAHRWQSVEQSSLDAWYEKYPLYTRPEESVSYYNKGQVAGVALDIVIRDRTDNRGSLDDVLRALNTEYAQRGRFYNESDDLRNVAEAVIRAKAPEASADLNVFFEDYISGTKEIPFSDLLARAGLGVRDVSQPRAALGFSIGKDTSGILTVASLNGDSNARETGVREGDVLAELNGAPFPRVIDRWLRDHRPDERVTITVRRGDEQKEFSFLLERQTESSYQISELPAPTDKQRRIRDGILHGTTDTSR